MTENGITRGEAAGMSYRAAGPENGPAVLLLHGFPETSRMWVPTLKRLGAEGFRALAPDMYDMGEPPPRPPATWERSLEDVERFRSELGIESMAIVVHDWGGFCGLAWACEHPDAVTALVISNTGFFSDGRWHEIAAALRVPGQGEQIIAAMERDGFAASIQGVSPGVSDEAVDEYWGAFNRRRALAIEFYRSMDFEKLAPYEGRLAQIEAPALLLWGEEDKFAPLSGAHRFQRDLPGAELEVIEGAGHFVFEDEPARTAGIVADFLVRARG